MASARSKSQCTQHLGRFIQLALLITCLLHTLLPTLRLTASCSLLGSAHNHCKLPWEVGLIVGIICKNTSRLGTLLSPTRSYSMTRTEQRIPRSMFVSRIQIQSTTSGVVEGRHPKLDWFKCRWQMIVLKSSVISTGCQPPIWSQIHLAPSMAIHC